MRETCLPAVEWCHRNSTCRTLNVRCLQPVEAQSEKLKGRARRPAPPCWWAGVTACASVAHAHSRHSLSSPRPGRQRPFLVTSPKCCVISARRGQARVFPPGAAGAGRAWWGEARAGEHRARSELPCVRSWPGPAHYVRQRRQPCGAPQPPRVPCSGLGCRRTADHQSHGEDSQRERGVLCCRNEQHPAGEGWLGAREARPASRSLPRSAASHRRAGACAGDEAAAARPSCAGPGWRAAGLGRDPLPAGRSLRWSHPPDLSLPAVLWRLGRRPRPALAALPGLSQAGSGRRLLACRRGYGERAQSPS